MLLIGSISGSLHFYDFFMPNILGCDYGEVSPGFCE
jgi:hypothetical protein